MMKTINVSTDVFAEIWRRYEPGDKCEDDIFRREFCLKKSSVKPEDASSVEQPRGIALGHYIEKYNVHFPEGFEIFRSFKGKEYRARLVSGQWLLNSTGLSYPSLNKLSWAVVNNNENAWSSWKYIDENGNENFINSLRDPSTINSRG